ncbi:MAG: hypothetical protein R3Y23_06385 [Bacillota bacterium]
MTDILVLIAFFGIPIAIFVTIWQIVKRKKLSCKYCKHKMGTDDLVEWRQDSESTEKGITKGKFTLILSCPSCKKEKRVRVTLTTGTSSGGTIDPTSKIEKYLGKSKEI